MDAAQLARLEEIRKDLGNGRIGGAGEFRAVGEALELLALVDELRAKLTEAERERDEAKTFLDINPSAWTLLALVRRERTRTGTVEVQLEHSERARAGLREALKQLVEMEEEREEPLTKALNVIGAALRADAEIGEPPAAVVEGKPLTNPFLDMVHEGHADGCGCNACYTRAVMRCFEPLASKTLVSAASQATPGAPIECGVTVAGNGFAWCHVHNCGWTYQGKPGRCPQTLVLMVKP